MRRNTSGELDSLLMHKFRLLAAMAVSDVEGLYRRFSDLEQKTSAEIADLYNFDIRGVD